METITPILEPEMKMFCIFDKKNKRHVNYMLAKDERDVRALYKAIKHTENGQSPITQYPEDFAIHEVTYICIKDDFIEDVSNL